MEERNSRYELQQSRNGLTVPVINEVFLHSIYNPIKEAEAFAETHSKSLAYKNKIIVLGLGFGYHVEQLAKILNRNHNSFEILIVEPNSMLVDDFISTRGFEDKNIKIINAPNVTDLFGSLDFVSYLMQKPAIIKHDASFILNQEYYTQLLSYQAPKQINQFGTILSENSKNIFSERSANTVNDYIDSIKSEKSIRNRNEFLLLALNEIRTTTVQGK